MRKLMALASMAIMALAMNGCVIWDDCTSCESDYWGWDYDYNSGWDDNYSSWDDCGCSSCDDWGGCACSSYDDSSISDDINVSADEPVNDEPAVDEDDGIGASCMFSRDCKNGLICQQHVCVLPGGEVVDPYIPPQVECYINSDCSEDEICTEGRCIPCQTDMCDTSQEVECVFSTQCDSGLCVNGSCLAAGACVVDANCNEGQICSNGECVARPECLNDDECGDGRICNASGSCEDDVECRIDSDCGDGKICVFNMCAECRLDCECPNEGDVCMNGACIAG
jgi:hypothetical protein